MSLNEFQRQMEEMATRMDAREAEEAKAKREKDRTEQIDLGFCNVIPFPKRVVTQPFRSELTIEKHSIFVSNQHKGEFFVREWSTQHPQSEERIEHRLTVGRTDKGERSWGVLTQVHQDVFYKLLKLWGDQNYPLVGNKPGQTYGSIAVTAYELVMLLRGSNSVREYRRVRTLLQELVSIPVVIENAYTWQGLQDRLQFTLLNGVTWSDRGVDKETKLPKRGGESKVTILFSDVVTEGFLQKHVKTLLLDPYQSLGTGSRARGEIARLLYPLLDAQLSTKENYHVRLQSLVERFGLPTYRYKSRRKQCFDPAVQLLNGKLIYGERYRMRVHLQETEDREDYMLVARRDVSSQLDLPLS